MYVYIVAKHDHIMRNKLDGVYEHMQESYEKEKREGGREGARKRACPLTYYVYKTEMLMLHIQYTHIRHVHVHYTICTLYYTQLHQAIMS